MIRGESTRSIKNKVRLSLFENNDLFYGEHDSFTEDGKLAEYELQQNKEILKKVQEMFQDDQDQEIYDGNQSILILNERKKQEILEELEEEFGQNYQETKVKINKYIKLAPKNDLQLALVYTDKYPLLIIRQKILITAKKISAIAQAITTNQLFEMMTLIVIVFNSVMLAMDDPTTNEQTQFQDIMDIVFLAYYTGEAVLKIIALGFIFPKKAYLKDYWNILDFIVIVTAYIPYFLTSSSVNLNALRSFRVLRPLRTVSSIKALRTILLALFASLTQLRDAIIVLLFFYAIFAIAGVQMFSGYLKNRCFGEMLGIEWVTEDEDLLCANNNDCPFENDSGLNENFICGQLIANPTNNLVNFDTFGWSFLQVFTVTTLEGWTYIQQCVIKTFSWFSVIYFELIVLIGAFFLVNLTLAIIKLNFKPEKIQEELAQIKEEIEEYDYIQLKQLKLYEIKREIINTEGYGVTWDKNNVIPLINDKYFKQINKEQVQTKRDKKKNKVQFVPITSAIYFSDPVLIQNDKIKLQGIYGMGNKIKQNEKIDKISGIPRKSNFNRRQSQLSLESDSAPGNTQQQQNVIDFLVEPPVNSAHEKKSTKKTTIILMEQLDQIQSPNIDLQTEKDSAKKLDNKRISVDSNNSQSLTSKKKKSQKQEVKSKISSKQKIQINKKIKSQTSLGEDFDSINLSELNSLSSDEIDQRLDDLGIGVNIQQSQSDQSEKERQVKELQRQKKIEKQKLKDANKNQQQLDENSTKLKLKLIGIKFHPIISIEFELINENDILVSKMKKLQELEIQQQQKLLKTIHFKATYCFKNDKQALQLKKSSSGKDSKSLTRSTYLKSNPKSKKSGYSLRRIKPITDELHPYEDLQIHSGQQVQQQQQSSSSESSEDSENAQNQEKNNNMSGSQYYKQNKKNKKKQKDQKSEKMGYEQMIDKFKEEEENPIFQIKLKQVVKEKNFTPQELSTLTPQDLELQQGVFYDEYVDIKYKDIEDRKGKFTTQASIEDVLLISDYTFYDSKFARQLNLVMKALNYNDNQTFIFLAGIIGFLKVTQRKILYIVESSYFEGLMNLAVAINTIILAIDGLVPDSDSNLLSEFNTAFTIIFTIELGVKLIGMGINEYIKDVMNIFDAIIVALSLVELFFLSGGSGKSSLSAFRSVRIFRAFRVLRVTKLMRTLKFMSFLMKVLTRAFQSIMYIMLLLVLFIFIFTLLGMAFFGGSTNDHTYGRQSFDDIQSAFLCVFQVLTLENWNGLLYELLSNDNAFYITIPYLVFWILIGNYVFLNLFLAILLETFEEEYKNDREDLDAEIDIGKDSEGDDTIQQMNSTGTFNRSGTQSKSKKQTIASEFENQEDFHHKKQKKQESTFIYFTEPGICHYAVYIFTQDNIFRRICYRIVKDGKFETLIFFMIFCTSIKLVYDTYIPNTGILKEISIDIDIFFAAFFGAEMAMKVIAFGFVLQESSYLRDSWNILDFFIVIASFIDVSVAAINLSFVKILRLLRTLRPLRFITHNRSMKILVSALLQSINGIFNVSIVVVLVWLMFAILGINLEKNKMKYCDLGDDQTYYYHYDECQQKGGVWSNHKTNFDNVMSGMLTLFILSTMEGWPDYMFLFMDADETGPIKNAQVQFSWFFVVFLLIGSILLLNLFIGVILVNYHLAEEAARDKILTPVQTDWIDLQKLIVNSSPNLAMFFCPENPFRAVVFTIIKSKYFDPAVLLVIIGNIVTMALAMEDSDLSYDDALTQLNTGFTFFFISEASLKIIALGPVGYMRNTWNQFDFFVVCASILDLILQYTGNSFISFLSAGPQLARVFRVLRVTRLFRLIKSFQGLQKLIETAIYSLPAMLNVTALLFLVYFIFSILGVFLFQNIESGWSIDSYNNFSDFHHAFLLLFRCSTGEDWYKVMFDTMEPDQQYYCVYWIIFIVIQQYIMLNLFVLIILDQYEVNYFNSDNPLNRFQEYENMFIESWSKFAKEDKGMKMNDKLLVPLMFDLEKPIGYELNTVIKQEIDEWRHLNPQLDTKENVQIQEQLIKAKARRLVSTSIMKMNIYSDTTGLVTYHQILFNYMKAFMWKKVQIDLTPEGAQKILQKEEFTQQKLQQLQFNNNKGGQVNLVNPIVKFLFVSMSYKALKRYGEKKKQQREQLQIEADQEHYSDGFSSDSSFDNKVEILSRNDILDNQNQQIKYGAITFLHLPNTEVYKGEQLQIDQSRSSSSDESQQINAKQNIKKPSIDPRSQSRISSISKEPSKSTINEGKRRRQPILSQNLFQRQENQDNTPKSNDAK